MFFFLLLWEPIRKERKRNKKDLHQNIFMESDSSSFSKCTPLHDHKTKRAPHVNYYFFFPFFKRKNRKKKKMEFNAQSLSEFNGVGNKPIYLSLKRVVYDVSSGADFYGPGKGYGVFSGKEVTRCLAKMKINDLESNAGWANLLEEHRHTMEEWVAKYQSKYPVVGTFLPDAHFELRGSLFEP